MRLRESRVRLLADFDSDFLVRVVNEHDVIEVVVREGEVGHESPKLVVLACQRKEVQHEQRYGRPNHARPKVEESQRLRDQRKR